MEQVKVFVAGALNSNILVTAGPYFTKLAWMVCLIVLMHQPGLSAESELKVSDAERG